ncbi:hypothetical protein LOAG_17514 [Loa loa]|uniref:GTP-binding protein Di-Ras2 n=1 Tax=Loa loa TaxID=7209 RepID=A0A1S0UIQ1_LOALO|nr:hypothetical protein LOAG_17514 [Loa loa]EJD75306.1 hypothetical protein LOAG_17514 [Loa loa]
MAAQSSGRIPAEHTSDYRVAVFGAGGVGKSSIVLRFIKGTFSENYIPTIEDTFRQAGFFYNTLLLWSVTYE